MAYTAIPDEEITEFEDSEEELNKKIVQLGDYILNSNYMMTFTGAGISTAAGISDFRGPQGVWTRKAKGLNPVPSASKTKARPTQTHMAIVKLNQLGYLKMLGFSELRWITSKIRYTTRPDM